MGCEKQVATILTNHIGLPTMSMGSEKLLAGGFTIHIGLPPKPMD